ncbi:hypothetical protein TWF730_010805 [Orbilia blumenaviensis]|uniref:Inner centromere protein ARK-binding domain-containing protein n=1 Tax=Orbilia blumenaviensis TaxID=1796055 RepID=A0AAV9UJM3_9PEZI
MASRPGLPEVGSPQWIFNELADAHRKEADHFEDFTIAFRNELEWLTEHMSEVFTQGSTVDITELYKTPGKLRGKTPRHFQKVGRIGGQKDADDFITPLAKAHSPIRPGRGLITQAATPQLLQSFSSSSDSITSTPELMRDSGSSAAGSFGIISSEPVERSSPAKVPSYQCAPEITGEIAERRTCSDTNHRSSMLSENHPGNQGSDTDGTAALGSEPQGVSPRELSEKADLITDMSPMTGDHIKQNFDSPITASGPQAPQEHTKATQKEFSVSPVQASTPVVPSSPISPIQQAGTLTTPKGPPADQVAGSDTPSEAASPTGVARSSMNFASLPARETLTYKKSMGGSNPTGPRSSHVDDRTSFFGRLTGGKSLGASSAGGEIGFVDTPSASASVSIAPARHHASDEEDEDDDLNEQLRLAEINKASVMQFSDKNPTQRLDEKIRQLSQQSVNRLSKSTSASSLLTANQAEEYGASKPILGVTSVGDPALPTGPRESIQSDEGDWIPSLPHASKAPIMHSSIASPSPIRIVPNSPGKAVNTSSNKQIVTPAITKLPISTDKVTDSKVSYPTLPALPLHTVESEPSSKPESPDELEISTVKKNQQNLLSRAKHLLWGSPRPASPSKDMSQDPNGTMALGEDQADDEALPSGVNPQQALYPEIQRSLPSDADESKLSAARFAPEAAPKHQKSGLITYGGIPKRAVQLKGPSSDVIEGIDLIPEHTDDLLRSPVISDNDPSLPGSPFFEAIASDDEVDIGEDSQPLNHKASGLSAISRVSPPIGNHREPRNRSSLQSKPSDLRKPNRALFGVKDSGIAKPKTTTASNIRLVAGSQREVDQRKHGHQNPLSNPVALVNALAETFGPTKEPHSRPLSSMSSSSTHSRQAPKSIAALNSAAKAQRREQEERERKAAQRQEIERKRQENLKREEVRREEERKQQLAKAAKKQQPKVSDDEEARKKMPTAGKGQQGLFHPSKLLSKTTPFSHKNGLGSSKSQPELKRQPKRVLPMEEESKSQREEVSIKEVSKQDSKRRKTGETGETPAPPTFAPPIRQSTARKENLPPTKIGGIFSQDYNTPASHSQALPAQIPKSTPLPHVDAVKYSHDKLKFGTMVTPSAQKVGRKLSAVPRESPVYPNPESIELPEIHTDSEDDDDNSVHVPKWADSPELRQALQDQLGIDPETIFGPIAPLSMEDIFRGRSDRAKFRARTSSANWSGADRLTTAEIEADRVERQRILDNGGWTYQKP